MPTAETTAAAKAGLELLKHVPRWMVFAAAFSSAAFLFLPSRLRSLLPMSEPDPVTGSIAGVSLLFFGFASAYLLLEPWLERRRKERAASEWLDQHMRDLDYLTDAEWEVLGCYYIDKQRARDWPVAHGLVQQLAARDYLIGAPVMGNARTRSFTIQDWIWRALMDGRASIPSKVLAELEERKAGRR